MPHRPAGHHRDAISEHPSAVVVTISGELDVATATHAWKLVDAAHHAAAAAGHRTLVIDLSDVTFMGSVGLAILASHDALAAGKPPARYRTRTPTGVHIRLVITSPAVTRPLTLSGLDRMFPVYLTRDAAVAATNT